MKNRQPGCPIYIKSKNRNIDHNTGDETYVVKYNEYILLNINYIEDDFKVGLIVEDPFGNVNSFKESTLNIKFELNESERSRVNKITKETADLIRSLNIANS